MTHLKLMALNVQAWAWPRRAARRLASPRGRATAFFALLNIAFFLIMLLWLSRIANHVEQVQVNDNRARCNSIVQSLHNPVPRPILGNPSREWEYRNEVIQYGRGRQIGCPDLPTLPKESS